MAERELTLPRFSARMHDAARRLGVSGFWEWWSRQLDPLVPAAPRAALERRRMRPVVVFEGDHATLWRPSVAGGRAAMAPAATIALTGDAAGVAAAGRAALAPTARMVYGGPAGAGRVVVGVPARDVLRKKVVLPAAVEENVKQALAYDLDRHTPFKPEELYFDAIVIERNVARGTITVDLAAVRRTVLDPALRHVASWGCDVAAVVPEPPAAAATSRLNLLPPELRTRKSIWTRWQFWLPLALLVVLALAAVAIPLWQKREYAKELRTLADQARARAAISETLRIELDTRVADYNTALERKYAFPSALAVVDTVSKLLPDDTWLTQFELKSLAKGKETQRDLLVRGETANAGRLVAAARGVPALRAGRATRADDQDPAGPGRDLRPGRAAEALDAAGAHRAGGFREACRRRCATTGRGARGRNARSHRQRVAPDPCRARRRRLPGRCAPRLPGAPVTPSAPPRLPRLRRRLPPQRRPHPAPRRRLRPCPRRRRAPRPARLRPKRRRRNPRRRPWPCRRRRRRPPRRLRRCAPGAPTRPRRRRSRRRRRTPARAPADRGKKT